MNKKSFTHCFSLIAAILFALSTIQAAPLPAAAQGGTEEDSTIVTVNEWLVLGPIATPLPAYNDEGPKKIEPTYMLESDLMDISSCKPASGKKVYVPAGGFVQWIKKGAKKGKVSLVFDKEPVQTAYLAAYVEAPRWLKVKIAAQSIIPFAVFVDGEKTIESPKPGKEGSDSAKEVALEQGSHSLIVKVVCQPSDTIATADFKLTLESTEGNAKPLVTTKLERYLSLGDILNLPKTAGVTISPDGKMIALTMSVQPKEKESPDRWLEIRRTADAKLLASIKDIEGLRGVKWAPVGRRLSYVTSSKGKSTINLYDFETGATTSILKDKKDLNDYVWSPKGDCIVYSITEKPKKENENVKRLRSISDRWSYGRMRSYLYIASVPGGLTRRLTAGKYSTNLLNVRPDGKAILFTRSYEDLSERPYGKTELVEMDLGSDRINLLWKGHWLNSAQYSPKGDKLLMLAGPSAFGDKGKNVPKGVIPNDYDGQGYIFDIKSKDVNAFTRDFNPSISSAVWSRADGNIYLVAEDSSFVRLFRYDTARKRFKRMRTGCDVVGWSSDISKTRPIAVLAGSSANEHARLYFVDLKRNRSRVLLDPNSETFSHIKMGRVENWDFTSSTGRLIKGRVHYPPDFDRNRKYPCIVYYYGGTEPVWRDFGGRYPKNLWAAMGYVVYVLQPSGATGFGQSFSALHVNDWGKIVAGEIIEGTKKFLDAHPFVDGKHVGCIGASYGGFMTQLLLTRTNMFAAAVSHAGINLIPHYWGEGYWGYAYNAVSAANSFPWNRKDIYVDQSPLFHADKITTPLLLLHGTADTNVPTGESDQMYTALKLLGRTVEYVQIKGQNHLITSYKRRVAWSNTILAWFDRWLKGEPEWWYSLYPDSKTSQLEGKQQKSQSSKAERQNTDHLKAGMDTSAQLKPEQTSSEQAEVVQAKAGSSVSPCSNLPQWIEGLEPHKVPAGGGKPILVGKVTREDIKDAIPNWDDEYYSYEPDSKVLSKLPTYVSNDISIKCILGTWCGDSMREVPRFWKVMEYAGLPAEGLEMFAVERYRAEPSRERPAELIDWSKEVRNHFSIKAVPTFIVCSGAKELGRIVEKPRKSLEEDLLGILKKK